MYERDHFLKRRREEEKKTTVEHFFKQAFQNGIYVVCLAVVCAGSGLHSNESGRAVTMRRDVGGGETCWRSMQVIGGVRGIICKPE